MVDAPRGLRRHVHAPHGRDDRERRAPLDTGRSGREPVEPPVGGGRLRAHPRIVPAGVRIAWRPARPPPDLRHRVRGFHRVLAAVRAGRERDGPQHLPRPPGRWRCRHVRHFACAHRAGVRGPRAGQGDRHLGSHTRRSRGHRAARGRGHHRAPWLGVGVLHQRPDRDRGGGAHRDQARERGRDRPAADRLERRGHFHPRPVRPDLRVDPGQLRGVGIASDPCRVRACGRDVRGVLGDRVSPRRAAVADRRLLANRRALSAHLRRAR